ncbi:MAG: hypothetical protein JWL86_5929 [Rhizobium sp.]|nr:hypothetical protein [Rhizobium sp.]
MGAHTKKLTTGTDNLHGTAGTDLFLAPKKGGKGTLGSSDHLDGGKGHDMLEAELVGRKLAPTLIGIEEAVFTRNAKADVRLDLSHSKKLGSLSFDNFHSDADVLHAGHVRAVSINNANGHDVTLTGADAKAMSVHSNGISSNALLIDPGKHHNTAIQTLTIDGAAALSMVNGSSGALQGLKTVIASAFTGDLTASFGGANLASVDTGSGHDMITITKLGGTAIDKALIDLSLGDDTLSLRHISIDAATMVFVGSDGTDTLQIDGAQIMDFFDAAFGFELLEIWNPSGNYYIDSGVTSVEFMTVTGVNSNIHIFGGTGLTRIVASSGSDQLWLEDIGGTAGDKAQLTMGDGDDNLYAYHIALDSTTQFYDGGDGYDYVWVSGNVQNLSTLFSDFESLIISGGTGTYNMAWTDFVTAWFYNSTVGSVTINHMASGGTLIFSADPSASVTESVENALASTTDSLMMTLAASATTLGTAASGLHAVSLSALDVHCDSSNRTVYLGELGASGDNAELTISGTHSMTIRASTGADLFIDKITITDTAGVNLLHLVDGDSSFSASGIFIFGGAGDDVIIGGSGADFMTTGAGANTVYGSLGIDDVTLSTNVGSDTFVFTNKNQSSVNSGDIISNFNASDVIDISAVVSSIAFGGDVANFASGLALLSTNHSVAFFDQSSHKLYIDVNHDGALSAGVDMEMELVQLASFSGGSLIG